MVRTALAALAGLLIGVTSTTANWVYLLPQQDRTTIRVVFADDLNPDPRVPIQAICKGKTQLFAIQPNSKPIEIKETEWLMEPKVQALRLTVPPGTQAIAGTTQMGYFKVHGTEIRCSLSYYPKVLIQPVKESQQPCCDAVVPFEIVPLIKEGKLHFQAIWQGQPVNKEFEDSVVGRSVFAVFPPDGKKMAMPVKVGEQAVTVAGYDRPGRYATWAVYTINKSGMVDGKEYDEERYYATLVVDFEPSK